MGDVSLTTLGAKALAQALGAYAGTSPTLKIYSGTAPASARAALSGNTMLVSLQCAPTPISGYADNGTTGVAATFAAISNATAAATGTAVFWRLMKNDGLTVIAQGLCGTTGTSMIMSTTTITAGSTVTDTSASITQPYGP